MGIFLLYFTTNEVELDLTLLPLVPIMTSNTTPSGVASASSTSHSTMPAWLAFDGDGIYTYWNSSYVKGGQYIQYQFENPIIIKNMSYKLFADDDLKYADELLCQSTDLTIKISNDGIDWENIAQVTTPNTLNEQSTLQEVKINNNKQCIYARVEFADWNKCYQNKYYCNNMSILQFYGKIRD